MSQSTSLVTTLATSLALIDQFLSSLETAAASQSPQQSQPTNHPSPLHLLSASSTSLKSSVTKLSLLAITTPFTPSAIISTLQSLNTSILPSLVTAALLTSPPTYPSTFAKECTTIVRVTLRDLKLLLTLIRTRTSEVQAQTVVSDVDKKNVTEATGRVWEDCDVVVKFAGAGVVGFVCEKVKQWLELMKDAVREFEEWDPEEEVGDDPFRLNEVGSDDDGEEMQKDADRAAMSAGVKDQALKVLSRIPQSVHVVVKQRLEKLPRDTSNDVGVQTTVMALARRKVLDRIVKKTRKISECIDESAEGMYMGDLEMCLKKAGEARALTIEVVEAVVLPWEESEKETKEDQYIKRALTWIQQVEPSGKQAVESEFRGKEKA